MKRCVFITLLCLGIIGLVTACAPKLPRTIDNPIVTGNNTSRLEITQVELTDSATTLSVHAEFRPHYWIRVSSGSVLAADGKNYRLISAEGIEPDKEFWMPDSGKANFKLIFEPLPAATQTFDFIEEPGGWQIWDIDAVGDRKSDDIYKEVPGTLKAAPTSSTLSAPVLTNDSATINVHMLAYRDGMPDGLSIYLNPLVGRQKEFSLKLDSLGNASTTLMLNGTTEIFFADASLGASYGAIHIDPGENIDVYLRPVMLTPRVSNYPFRTYSNGHHADWEYADANARQHLSMTSLYTPRDITYADTHDVFLQKLVAHYNAWSDSINAMDLPEAVKEYSRLRLQGAVMNAVAEPTSVIYSNFYRSLKEGDNPELPFDSIKTHELDETAFAVIGKLFDTGNPKLIMTGLEAGPDWRKHGATTAVTSALTPFAKAIGKAEKMQLTDSMADALATGFDPFFRDAALRCQADAKAAHERLSNSGLLQKTPEVAPEKLLQAIVAPYKGKVVLVDLWNTWCGPCRASIKANEPLKSTELASDDIVWIYIADESSPATTYMSMIPDIKGLHYRLSGEQIQKIRDQFKVDGIPYYIFVDRTGKATGRPDFRNHDLMKSELLKAVK